MRTVMVVVALAGCTNLKLPPSDSTPAVAGMSVTGTNRTADVSLTQGATWTVMKGEDLVFIASADDEDGGAHLVRITGDLDVYCVQTNGPLAQMISSLYTNQAVHDAMVGDLVPATLFTSVTVKFTDLGGCQSGYQLMSAGSTDFVAYAENYYHGGTTTQPFSFTYTP